MVANPYREHLYVASRDSLAVIGSMHRVVARIPLTGDPNNIMIDRDGNRVFVTNYDGSIAVINTENHSIDTFPASGIQTWWSAPTAHSSSLRTTQPSATTFRIGIERSARKGDHCIVVAGHHRVLHVKAFGHLLAGAEDTSYGSAQRANRVATRRSAACLPP
jgi:hypothetical protein